jgi:integrase
MLKSWNAQTIQFLTQGEMQDLLGVIPTLRDRALFLVAYRHGLRASEVGLIQLADLDLAQ